jgi:N-terminal domain of anti-restriction factor ArdC
MRNLRSHPTQRRDHYQELTDKIIAALEAGVARWRRPWDPSACGGSNTPVNVATGHRYRGVNLFVLGMSPLAFTSDDPRWCSYRQAAARGWQVRKGEKATPVYFYKPIEIEDKTDGGSETRRSPVLRTFSVFHASQIDGVRVFAPRLRRRRFLIASRTSRSSFRRAACRFGSGGIAPSTARRSTSFKCLRTKPFTVRKSALPSSFTN